MSIFNQLKEGVRADSVAATHQLARAIAEALPEQSIITLQGDLGAGKTTFVKGLAHAWGITETVTSPTFNIYQVYSGKRRLVHMDAYRLEPSDDIVDELMLEEFLTPPYCLSIEWPSKLGSLPWDVFAKLHFEIDKDDARIITILP